MASTTATSRGYLWPAAGITLAIIGWGSLVYAAIDFGARGRAGETSAWFMLALSSLGAVVCLFAALLLAARILQQVKASAGSESAMAGRPGRGGVQGAAHPTHAGQRAASAQAATSGPEPTVRLDHPGEPPRTSRTQPLSDPLSDPLWTDLPTPAQPTTPPGSPRPRHAGGHRAG